MTLLIANYILVLGFLIFSYKDKDKPDLTTAIMVFLPYAIIALSAMVVIAPKRFIEAALKKQKEGSLLTKLTIKQIRLFFSVSIIVSIIVSIAIDYYVVYQPYN